MSVMEPFDPYQEWLEIPPGERPVDHYRLLGLARFEEDAKSIERAADERMAHVRKFQTGPRGRHTQKLLNELAAAKLCLLDPVAKQRYDLQLVRPPAAAPASVAVPPPVAPPAAVAPPLPPTGAAPPPTAPLPVEHPRVRPLRSAAARRRRTTSGIGCVLMLAVIALCVTAFAALLILARPKADPKSLSAGTQGPVEAAQPADPGMQPPRRGRPGKAEGLESEPGGPTVVVQEASGAVNLPASVAVLHGDSLRLGATDEPNVVVGWTSDSDWVQWHFRLVKAGVFRVELHYSLDQAAAGGRFELLVDERVVERGELRLPAGPGERRVEEHFVGIRRAGRHTLAIRPQYKPGQEFMQLFEVRLLPAQVSP